MRAKKSFGQHFLNTPRIAERIADSLLQAEKIGKVLEVGPGKGMLTQFLLEKKHETWAVEADQDMVRFLQKTYSDWAATHLIEQDFLKFEPYPYFQKEAFCLIGNFPYNISTQILFKLLDYKHQIPEMVGMFQKEVADRVVAPAGNKTYGITSVLMQAFFDCEYLFTVEAGSFTPPPKVRSAVIRLTRKEGFELGCDAKLFKKIVKAAFGQRRKMIRNTLKVFFPNDDLMNDDFFQHRPERLTWQDFVMLTNRCKAQRD